MQNTPCLLILLLAILPRPTAAINYEVYPSCAEQCLESEALSSGCSFTTDAILVTCLCNSPSFNVAFAQCIYKDCGADALNSAATIHEYNCNVNGSPSVVDEQQFIADGTPAGVGTGYVPAQAGSTSVSAFTATAIFGGASTPSLTMLTTDSSATQGASSPRTSSTQGANGSQSTNPTTATPAPAPSSSNSGNNTLSTASLVGTIIGSVAGAGGSIAGAIFAYKKYKRDKEKEKASELSRGWGPQGY